MPRNHSIAAAGGAPVIDIGIKDKDRAKIADGLARVLGEFLDQTEPAPVDDADWGDVIAERAPRSPVGA